MESRGKPCALIIEWSTMNGARLICTGRVVQTRREISISTDVLSGMDVGVMGSDGVRWILVVYDNWLNKTQFWNQFHPNYDDGTENITSNSF